MILLNGLKYARCFLMLIFSPKYYFNNLCFEVPQNVTWSRKFPNKKDNIKRKPLGSRVVSTSTGINEVRLSHHVPKASMVT